MTGFLRIALAGVLLQLAPAPAPDPAPAPEPADSDETAVAAEPVAAWDGALSEGLGEMRRLVREDLPDEALAVGERLLAPTWFLRRRRDLEGFTQGWSERALGPLDPALDAFGLGGYPEPVRAEVRYALGLAQRAAGDRPSARGSFERAAAEAGPGDLRADALYDAGTVQLEMAEALRLEIPEVQAALGAAGAPPGMPGLPGMPGGPGAGSDPDEPDPLELAAGAYDLAKAKLTLRLRLDWRDEDTRANLEWIQRRLDELDEIRRQREQQEPPPQDQEQQSQEPQDGEQGESGQSGEEGDPQDESEPEDSEEQDPSEPEDSEEDEPQPSPPEPTEEEGPPEQAPVRPEEEAERVLTREEVLRLLDRLQAIEDEGEALRALLRQRGRRPVEKDW